jgi:ribosomal protein S18 acetylase RimI-like enzyme
MVEVRELAEDDWELLRDVRLAALSDAPYAFGSTHAREAAFTEQQWRDRILSRGVTFLGFLADAGDAGEPAGVSGVYTADGAADLVSMWVRPSARGRGVGESLIVAAWAKARGYDTLYLWVTESNAPARRLYERFGFTPTGERQPLPSDPALSEIQMSRPL